MKPLLKTHSCLKAAVANLTIGAALFAATSLQAVTRDITTFGAIANDAGDDTTAIQATINASGAGDIVLVPNGTFNVTNQLTWKSGVTLQGAGQNTAILKVNGGSMSKVINVAGGKDIAFKTLTLDGNNIATNRDAIYSVGVSNQTYLNLTIKNFQRGHGIYVRAGTNTSILTNFVANMNLGATSTNQWAGIWVQSLSATLPTINTKITGNTTSNTGWNGIWCSDWVRDTVISGNFVKSTGMATNYSEGMHLGGHDNVRMLVENNTVDRFLSVSAGSSGYSTTDIAIRNNKVKRTASDAYSYAGIELVGKITNLVCADNLCEFQQRGIAVTSGGTQYAYFAYNTCTNNTEFGFATFSSTNLGYRQFFLYKNQFVNTSGAGSGQGIIIEAKAAGASIKYWDLDGNTINNNTGYCALQFQNDFFDCFTFVNNFIQNNSNNAQNYPAAAPSVAWSANTVTGNANNSQPSPRGFGGDPRPTANFNAAKSGLTVTFTNTSTGAARYLWDFGSGLPSTATNPVYTFPAAGTYRVSLVSWTSNGRGQVKAVNISVP